MSRSIADSTTTAENTFSEKDAIVTLTTISEGYEAEVGYSLYKQTKEEGLEWTEKEEIQVLRRIDWRILPVFCVTQGLAYLDKTALNLGNLFGMKAYVLIVRTEPVLLTPLKRSSYQRITIRR